MVNVQTNEGSTPPHEACNFGNKLIDEILMLLGADETICDDERQTRITIAWKKGLTHLYRVLSRAFAYEQDI